MIQHSAHRHQCRRRDAGVGLVTAIFLLVVLAGLGVALVSIFSSQQASSSLDEQGARALQAARAGIEWGLYQKMEMNNCPAASTFALPAGSTLSGFSVTVTCTTLQFTADPDLNRYLITAVACNQPKSGTNGCPNPSNSPDYVQRQLEVQI
jgi:MSHA biogenesis protein MshP